VLEEYTGEGANRNVEASYLYGNDLISQQQGTEELFYLEDAHSGVRTSDRRRRDDLSLKPTSFVK
jgi:hypothetical protein